MFLQLAAGGQGGRKNTQLLLPSHKWVCGRCDWFLGLRNV